MQVPEFQIFDYELTAIPIFYTLVHSRGITKQSEMLLFLMNGITRDLAVLLHAELIFEMQSLVSFLAIRRHYSIPTVFQPRAHISTLPGNF